MATPNAPVEPRRYDGWELRPAERVLCVDGRPVQIGNRAFDVLLALVEREGQVVAKCELLDAAWPGLVVEENNISVQIAALRKHLGRWAITTISGIGYRLSARRTAAPGSVAAPSEPVRPTTEDDRHDELLGRDEDLSALIELVSRTGLTSVVGAGGVGKTRLVREVFARHRIIAPELKHWVDLAPIRTVDQFVPLLAKSLGMALGDDVQAAGTLVAALSQSKALVVLDNCEHLLSEVSDVVELALRKAPLVRWLATTQEPLHISEETVYRLGPLTVPARDSTPTQAMEYGSVALLCQRAAAADRRFRLDDSNVAAAIALCEQLDGLPLAIEMAATRVATFGLEEVRSRLGERLRLLTRPKNGRYRHSTLQGIFDWSFGLLTEAEQAVFRRLEPFLGGFPAAMAERVTADANEGGAIDRWQALDALDALVDKSLVQRSETEPRRFHLLESARDYARLQLERADETKATRRRHAHAVADWFADAPEEAERMNDAEWLQRYASERNNVRAALESAARERMPDELARLTAALAMMDLFLCRQAEILQCPIPLDVLAEAQPRLRGIASLELSWSHYHDGDRALGTRLAHEAHEIFTSLNDAPRAYRALAQYTRLCEAQPGMSEQAADAWDRLQSANTAAMPLRTRLFCGISAGLLHRPGFTPARMQELGQLADGAGFDAMAGVCGCNVTDKMLILGSNEEAAATATRLLATGKRLPRARAVILHNQALALIRLGRIEEAYTPGRLAFHAMPSIAHFLVDLFALAAAREGRLADAAVLSGCGTRIRQERHEQPDLSEAMAIDETAALLQQGIPVSQLAELMQIGATMSAVEALMIKVFPREKCLPATVGTAAAA